MNRAEKAKELFCEGYNCSQAVAAAFSDLIGMDEKTAARLVSGFGGGIGRLREVCGSVSGMVFVLSALYGYDNTSDDEAKKELYATVQKLCAEFKEENGSIICRELLGLDIKGADSPAPEKRTQAYYKKRPCPEIVYSAAEILENYIKENGIC